MAEDSDNDRRHAEGDELAEVRRLLVRPEQERLDALQERLDDPHLRAGEVGDVLPEAIRSASAGKDGKLSRALGPALADAISVSIEKSRDVLVDAIFPLMGPAISKGIYDALRRMMQSLSQIIEQGFSARGVKWRLEAWRTGKSYGEIVLARTLLYRVEQVFLIHRESGLLLQHVAAPAVAVEGSDMVSGMLTAIQDFVRDSFSVDSADTLGTLEIGELTVWVEPGPHASLAGVIRGVPPPNLRSEFREAIEIIHGQAANEFASFEGDTTPFDRGRPHLEACLVEAERTAERRGISPTAWAAVAGIAVVLGVVGYGRIREGRRWQGYLQALRDAPGIVVTTAEKRGGRYHVHGLRDPLAESPERLAEAAGISPDGIIGRWEPYEARHSPFVLARATEALKPPHGVELGFDAGVLEITGRAQHAWLVRARETARLIPGVAGVHEEGLVVVDVPPSAIEQARAVLAPPQSATLTIQDGILLASGSAPYDWVTEARRLAHLVPGVRGFGDEALTVTDRPKPVLTRARELLGPPDTVDLSYHDGVLSGSGSAPGTWVAAARRLATLLRGVETYRDDDIVVSDGPRPALEQAMAVLSPPETATFRFDNGVLSVRGAASYQWLASARMLVRLIPEVTEFRSDGLSVTDGTKSLDERVRSLLAPPETASLRIAGGIAEVSGTVPHQWLVEARTLIRVIPEIDTLREVELTVTGRPMATIDLARAVLAPPDTVTLMLEGRILLAEGSAPAQWIADAKRLVNLIPGIDELRSTALVDTDDPASVLARAKKALAPPDSVSLAFESGILYAAGEADHPWLERTRKKAAAIAGVRQYVDERVVNMTRRGLEMDKERIEGVSLYFHTGSTNLMQGEAAKLARVAVEGKRLLAAAKTCDLRARIIVMGHANKGLFATQDLARSHDRARTIFDALVAQGLPRGVLAAVGTGPEGRPAESKPSENRRVSFQISFADLGGG